MGCDFSGVGDPVRFQGWPTEETVLMHTRGRLAEAETYCTPIRIGCVLRTALPKGVQLR